MTIHTFEQLSTLAQIAPQYRKLRQQYPHAKASDVFAFCAGHQSEPFEQFICHHKWTFTGTAYGGDDERWNGEGRCYCIHCGADGDA